MNINTAYQWAKEEYAALGVDTDKALFQLVKIPISLNCWQGDDVGGFEHPNSKLEGGGIQVTGSYPGKARNILELQQDIEKTLSLIPGTYRLNLHANYADLKGKKIDRDALLPEHFKTWLDWAQSKNINLDFNSTFFSHPKANDLTLCSKDKGIRDFWIEHAKRCREIGAYFGEKQKNPCIHNIWIADGMKDIPADRLIYRSILSDSLDEILKKKISSLYLKDSVESKVFGIGTESYVAGSHEFYLGYAISRNILLTLDLGHYHPTENVADKLSAIMLTIDEILLHISRPVRWDSDHVVIFNDDLRVTGEEIIKSKKTEKIHIGLDFFDGSINRIGAWTLGCRSTQKALLAALLQPQHTLTIYEDEKNFFGRLFLFEQMKTFPFFGFVWQKYCEEAGVPQDYEIIKYVKEYEKLVTNKRG
ncbi:L-rhamnose isomerase [Treponema sp. OMZ 840]|uniref:L-rhamnose isomerase n=1 Tax=Treponema sp. OMZ 840 TaxID=244313 RepID=UPI003D8D356B